MRKDQLVFLVGGLAFGFLFGFGIYHAWYAEPDLGGGAMRASSPPPSSSMPQANPTSAPMGNPGGGAPMGNPGGGAPMVAEINQLKRKVQDDPTNLAAWVKLGNLHYDVQMWPQAAGFYEKAIELEPHDPDVLTDLGVCYRGTGQFDRALEMFDRASALDAAHYQSLFNIVVVAGFDLKDYARAERALVALEAFQPKPPKLDELRHALGQQRAAAGG